MLSVVIGTNALYASLELIFTMATAMIAMIIIMDGVIAQLATMTTV